MADGTLIFDTKLDTDGLFTEVNKLNKSTSAFGDVMKGVLGANIVQQAGEKLIDFAKSAITAASDLQEVQNVVDVTFGENADIINDFATDGAKAFGLTELQTKRYTGTLGALFKSMGLGQDEVTDFSVSMAGLVGDMASFYNLDYDTAFEKLRSGISGETEPLKQLGVNMSVANLEAFALAQGIKTSYEEMTEAQKATLRYQYIMEATADAQGDFNRTQDSFANQMRTLENNFSTLSANVGETLLPVLTSVISAINSIFNWSFGGEKTELQKSIDAARESLDGVDTELNTIKTNYATTTLQITVDYKRSQQLLDDYDALSGIENRTEDQTKEMQAIVETLVGMYPELEKYVGKDGLFKNETEQVQGLISEYKALAEAKAREAMITDIQTQAWKAEFEYAQLEASKTVAEENLAMLEEQYAAMLRLDELLNNQSGFMFNWGGRLTEGTLDTASIEQAAEVVRTYIDAFGGFNPETTKALVDAGVDVSTFIDAVSGAGDLGDLDTTGIENLFKTISELWSSGDVGDFLVEAEGKITTAKEEITSANEAMAAGAETYQQALTDLQTAVAAYEKLTGTSGEEFLAAFATDIENGESTVLTSAGTLNTNIVKEVADTTEVPTQMALFESAISDALKNMTLPELEVAIRANYIGFGSTPTVGPVAKSHATGIERVPYDNYLANLHRGEAVLRADDAARWRSGQSSSGNNTAAIAALAQSVEAVASRPVKVYVGKKEIITAVSDGMYTEMNNISRTHARGVGK